MLVINNLKQQLLLELEGALGDSFTGLGESLVLHLLNEDQSIQDNIISNAILIEYEKVYLILLEKSIVLEKALHHLHSTNPTQAQLCDYDKYMPLINMQLNLLKESNGTNLNFDYEPLKLLISEVSGKLLIVTDNNDNYNDNNNDNNNDNIYEIAESLLRILNTSQLMRLLNFYHHKSASLKLLALKLKSFSEDEQLQQQHKLMSKILQKVSTELEDCNTSELKCKSRIIQSKRNLESGLYWAMLLKDNLSEVKIRFDSKLEKELNLN